jgi:hypothetical protein
MESNSMVELFVLILLQEKPMIDNPLAAQNKPGPGEM